MSRCEPAPFRPVFPYPGSLRWRKVEGGPGSQRINHQDTHTARVRYCVNYPDLPPVRRKKAKADGGQVVSSGADWCFEDDEGGEGRREAPPSYEEALLESKAAFEDAAWLGAPLSGPPPAPFTGPCAVLCVFPPPDSLSPCHGLHAATGCAVKTYEQSYYQNLSSAEGPQVGTRRPHPGSNSPERALSQQDEHAAKNLVRSRDNMHLTWHHFRIYN